MKKLQRRIAETSNSHKQFLQTCTQTVVSNPKVKNVLDSSTLMSKVRQLRQLSQSNGRRHLIQSLFSQTEGNRQLRSLSRQKRLTTIGKCPINSELLQQLTSYSQMYDGIILHDEKTIIKKKAQERHLLELRQLKKVQSRNIKENRGTCLVQQYLNLKNPLNLTQRQRKFFMQIQNRLAKHNSSNIYKETFDLSLGRHKKTFGLQKYIENMWRFQFFEERCQKSLQRYKYPTNQRQLLRNQLFKEDHGQVAETDQVKIVEDNLKEDSSIPKQFLIRRKQRNSVKSLGSTTV